MGSSKSDGKLCTVYGLTGSIAAGKSTVAKLFAQSGRFEIVDADQIVHQLYEAGSPVADQIKATFGTLNRKQISEKVFQDSTLRKILESILHPAVHVEALRQFSEISARRKSDPHFLGILYEAALLIEAGRAGDFPDGIILVTAPEAIRKKRLMQRNQKTSDEADAILASQMPETAKRRHARWEIRNDGDTLALEARVTDLVREMAVKP